MTPQQIAALAAQKHPAFHVPSHPNLQRWSALFSSACAGKPVDPCMLAAIVNRESGGRNVLQEGVPPGDGCGVGLCQITYAVQWQSLEAPVYPGYGNVLNPLINLRVAVEQFLVPALAAFPGNHRAAFAAYNLGIGGVQQEIAEGIDVDTRTTGGNYGYDVFTNWINFNAASLGLSVEWLGKN